MEIKEMLSYVDHTQLQPYTAWKDIKKLCEEALEYHTASVCIPPCYIKRVFDEYNTICKASSWITSKEVSPTSVC